jgi:hypothetical protein
MAFINYKVIQLEFSWKTFGATNLIVIFFMLNWLPKSLPEMDEREKIEAIEVGSKLNTLSSISILCVFMIHLIWFQEMTIIHFMLYSGIPIIMATCFYSYKQKRSLAED